MTRIRCSKKVFQFDLEGNYIYEWDSAKQVEHALRINSTHICNCRVGTRLSAGGFIWLSENNEVLAKEKALQLKQPILRSDSRRVIMIDKITDEPLQEFLSIRYAELHLGIPDSKGKINQVIVGKRSSAYGYKWKLVEE